MSLRFTPASNCKNCVPSHPPTHWLILELDLAISVARLANIQSKMTRTGTQCKQSSSYRRILRIDLSRRSESSCLPNHERRRIVSDVAENKTLFAERGDDTFGVGRVDLVLGKGDTSCGGDGSEWDDKGLLLGRSRRQRSSVRGSEETSGVEQGRKRTSDERGCASIRLRASRVTACTFPIVDASLRSRVVAVSLRKFACRL